MVAHPKLQCVKVERTGFRW